MQIKRTAISLATAMLLLTFSLAGLSCDRRTSKLPAEPPEEVVKKFYAYIHEGGPTTLGEAYKLISTKNYKLDEDIFKAIVAKYSKNMNVTVVGTSRITDGMAVVSIESSVPSTFGEDYVQQSDVNLDLDEKTNSWKIDFTGETYPDFRSQGSESAGK